MEISSTGVERPMPIQSVEEGLTIINQIMAARTYEVARLGNMEKGIAEGRLNSEVLTAWTNAADYLPRFEKQGLDTKRAVKEILLDTIVFFITQNYRVAAAHMALGFGMTTRDLIEGLENRIPKADIVLRAETECRVYELKA